MFLSRTSYQSKKKGEVLVESSGVLSGNHLLSPYVFVVLLSFVSNPVFANGFLDLIVSGGYEDNVSRGFLDRDVHSSAFHHTRLSGGKLFQPSINTSLTVSASGSYQGFLDQSGFDVAGLSAGINIQQKLGMGAYTPRLLLSVSGALEDSQGAQRDRALYAIDVGYFQRLTAGLSINLGLLDQTSRGTDELPVDFDQLPYGSTRPTDPMDYSNTIIYGGIDYVFANGWQISLGYQDYNGYIISSAVPPVQLYRYTKAVALDPAFDNLHLMYLMDVTADMWSSGVSIPLTGRTAIDLNYSWQTFSAEYVGDYDNSQVSISLVHQF